MAKSRFSIAKADIVSLFEESEERIYSHSRISQILEANRAYWRLTQTTTTQSFIKQLLESTKLETCRFAFPNRPIIRYTWGPTSIYEIIQSIDSKGYFSHYTGVSVYQLTDQIPKRLYFNIEQMSPGGGTVLNQSSIDRAFRNKCRQSNNIAMLGNLDVCMISGKNTDNLGVITPDTSFGRIRVTNLERTLIDITVRPIYSGGVAEVAQAFKNAAGQVSVNKLVSYLKKLNYTYPYHQAIGYYLSRAGVYKQSQIDLLKELPIDFDFYLTYQMKNPDYNEEWRLFIPKGF